MEALALKIVTFPSAATSEVLASTIKVLRLLICDVVSMADTLGRLASRESMVDVGITFERLKLANWSFSWPVS